MLTRIPIISSPLGYNDILDALRGINDKSVPEKLTAALSEFIKSQYIYLTNSGISSFYLILEALKEKSEKKEVILPAYTAGSLVVGVIKAGLKPVLCDISLEDFNLDRDFLNKVISRDTLAIVCVHMFGIGIYDIEELRENISSDICLIEDCAQAMGTKIKGKRTGNFTEISFFSFNRGKNLPAGGGGCVATNSEDLAKGLNLVYRQRMAPAGRWSNFTSLFKVLAFCLAAHPFIYGFGHSLISRFKDTAPPKDFALNKINNFQAKLVLRLLREAEASSDKRYKNGLFLIDNLRLLKGIIAPKIFEEMRPVFNRLPVIFEDLNKKIEAQEKLWKAGIDTSTMYQKPLHHMFDLGYKKEEFPHANYFAQHLLTLPVHRLIGQKDLLKIVEIIKSAVNS